ncbi:Synaptic vesicle protein EHS-1 and related EH domain proteins [Phaffia rhodozyma]|uniref:Synaptic vesicle protein EHS-1 and related EH domain proteins n=1 Tax=Phaffia rhodozyma TaxID=264483 RepID=A0A0F7SF04_PHARH|nr:Synaptic vesicle protein EHS-1 and related EH domain proteins [Phaffia rhodozyma]
MASAPLSSAEQTFYPSLFSKLQENNVISGAQAFSFLTLSDLPHPVLGEIWATADVLDRGSLDVAGWTVAMRLIASAQQGGPVNAEVGNTAPFTLPKFRGHPPPPASVSSRPSVGGPSLNPPLTQDDIAKFSRHFQMAGPSPTDGRLMADKATAIFLKSKLPSQQLGQIWDLADTHDRGSLDQTDFIVGMYFIQAIMSGKIREVPLVLPPGLYETASGSQPVGGPSVGLRQMTASPAPISRQVTGQQIQAQPATPVQRQLTGQQPLNAPTSYMSPHLTGGSFSAFSSSTPLQQSSPFGSSFTPAPQTVQVPWDVTPAEKQASDKFFAQLDKFGRGVIEGDVAVPFMLESKLSELVLATIWDLADIRKEGNLTEDEFAVAMHLIKAKIAGKELPATLPLSLVPPSLREVQPAPQPAAANPQRDLFDAFNDTPPASTPSTQNYFATAPTSAAQNANSDGFGMSPFGASSTVEKDLLGDDDPFTPASSILPVAPSVSSQPNAASPAPPVSQATIRSPPPPVTSRSAPANAELTQLRAEHSSLSEKVSELQSSGSTLESKTLDTKKEIMDLQAKLISLRSTHDSEKGNVDRLEARANEQAAEMKALQSELISAESELSSLRAQKNEFDGQIMGDKEEIRGMKRRLVEIGEETVSLKAQLEKIKREARQQRGLVAITQKQLTTSEAEKEKTLSSIADAEKGIGMEEPSPFPSFSTTPVNLQTVAQIPLPDTPQRVLSPALSTTSQKSNNPFDRFVPSPATAFASVLPTESPSSPSVQTPKEQSEAVHTPAEPIKDLAAESPSSSPLGLAAAGIAAAGTALVGVGSAIFGAHKDVSDTEDKEENDKIPQEPNDGVTEEKAISTPVEPSTHSSAFDDSFGTTFPSSTVVDDGLPASRSSTGFDDTFGDDVVAPSANADEFPTSVSTGVAKFDQGFDSSFEDNFHTPSNSAMTLQTGPSGLVGQGTIKSPSDVPFDDFEASFGDSFTPVEPSLPQPSVTEVAVSATDPLEEAQSAAKGGQVGSEDSSDDEDDGPEDLDTRAVYNNGTTLESSDRDKEINSGPPSNLTSTASAFSTDDFESIPAHTDHPLDQPRAPSEADEIPVAFAHASPSIPALTEQTQRRVAPPPPPRPAPVESQSEHNPFGTDPFETEQTSNLDSFDPLQKQPKVGEQSFQQPLPVSAVTTVTESLSNIELAPPLSPGFTKLEEYDTSEFVKVSPTKDASHAQNHPTSAPASRSSAFDDDFDTFDTDFGSDPGNTSAFVATTASTVNAPPSLTSFTRPVIAPAQNKNVDFDFDPSFADFDSTFETFGPTTTIVSQPAQTGASSVAASGFSFDDAFGEEPSHAPSHVSPVANSATTVQETFYAPPQVPPSQTAQRPELPSRKTAAEPDDIPDVKKIVSMGFSRSQALNALEIGNYNLQAAIDHLVTGS